MVQAKKASKSAVEIRIELFGQARLAAGQRWVDATVPSRTGVRDLAEALAEQFPELVGKAIRDDRSGLLESYTFNLNGTEFIDNEQTLTLTSEDTILLFSSQAGG